METPHTYPASWYRICGSDELDRGPVAKEVLGRELVAFRTESGRVGVMHARCVHMGTSLANGRVNGEALRCSFHEWEFGVGGRCTRIPAQDTIPAFARQRSYPAAEQHGSIFFFNGPEPLFPLPFYDGVALDDVRPGPRFSVVFEAPWYMIGANAVDVQHFRVAHDRVLRADPSITYPAPHAHRTTAHFDVAGNSLGDRLTRRFLGGGVTLEMTDWASTLMLVRASFPRGENYGFVSVVPLSPDRFLCHVTPFVRRSRSWLGRTLFDPINAFIRGTFTRKFLESDIANLNGSRITPGTLIEADHLIGRYLEWLAALSSIAIRPPARGSRPQTEPAQVACPA